MCLSIPSKVIQLETPHVAMVDTMGVQRQVSLDLMPEPVEVGDYVLIHVGFAMNKIDQEDALESLKLYQQIHDSLEAEAL
uniref:Hydrogenase assembly chaperone HypC n=1 Tax=Hydrogenovibrio crunogenus (strain DSM 25203 / XCL-2) TaxID=317025 RepID=Q31DZ1_HYDCU